MQRRDNKGRILRRGESQRADGRYAYKYTDLCGESHFIYSWRLEPTDSTPVGKKETLALRDMIRVIQRDINDEILPLGGNITVIQLVEKYIMQKTGVRHNTRANYNFILNIIKSEPFGRRRIDTVRLSDAKAWFIKLQKDGRGYSTIHAIRGVIRPAFQMAVDDDLLRKNPFEFMLATVVVNDSVTREAITREQERKYLEFVKNDKHFSRYYEGIYILFKTGLRISEFTGLTIADIDLKENRLTVDHQLQRKRTMEYVIEETKTISGCRTIPISDDVAECFRKIIGNRRKPKVEPMIDGRCGFLYLDKNDMPLVALHWQKYMQRIRQKYNGIYRVQLPPITPHVCRHTYCSNMAKSGMNPKTLQYLMGHADISVTLNTYTHFHFEDAVEEVKRLGNNK